MSSQKLNLHDMKNASRDELLEEVRLLKIAFNEEFDERVAVQKELQETTARLERAEAALRLISEADAPNHASPLVQADATISMMKDRADEYFESIKNIVG